MVMAAFLPVVSAIFGWIYFLAWSLSFYPQPVLNFRRRSTTGTTIDFPLINTIAFCGYSVSNILFYSSPVVRAQYAARHPGLTPTVQINDVVFAVHAAVVCSVTLSQYLLGALWGCAPNPVGERPSRAVLGVVAGFAVGFLATWAVVAWTPRTGDPAVDWGELDIVYALGYIKLISTVIKFAPQVLVNYRNRSTHGWSIWQILFDLTGGVLSASQQAIDSWLQGDWSGITGNPVKFGIANVSIIYDVIFMWQHYVLYRDANADDKSTTLGRGESRRSRSRRRRDSNNPEERQGLLPSDEERRIQ